MGNMSRNFKSKNRKFRNSSHHWQDQRKIHLRKLSEDFEFVLKDHTPSPKKQNPLENPENSIWDQLPMKINNLTQFLTPKTENSQKAQNLQQNGENGDYFMTNLTEKVAENPYE